MAGLFKKNLSSLLRGPDPDKAWFRRRPWPGPFIMNFAAKQERLIALNDRLAGLAESNMPFADALVAFATDERRSRPFHWATRQTDELLTVMAKDLRAGYSLSEAMARRPRFFPKFYRELVRTGEESGKLTQTLRDLSEQMLHRLDMQLRLQSYLSYLLAVFFVVTAVLLFVVRKILPVAQEVLEEFGTFAYPPDWLPTFLAVLFGGICLLLLLSVPAIRFMQQRRRLGWFAFSMQKLLDGAVPFEEALELAGGQDRWNPLRPMARRVRTRVLQGHSFTDALRAEGRRIPRGMTAMTSLGESTGRLPEALGKIADLYLAQARRHARVLLDVLSPLALLAMGGMVLAVCAYLALAYSHLADALVLY
jgi:type II secretory pathway component PulF